ncbi:MAG: hypothetical protein H6658_12330 [Ardenticatenaceae bacterium]|nr:hypothetical protein [Ardenticatenaceae bacterium]
MSRLQNQQEAGYFPIPPEVTDLIINYITAPEGGRVLDPCAGEGEALYQISQALGLVGYGVELAAHRAAAAQQLLGENVLHDDYRNLKTTQGAYNLVYNNPPYMFAADGNIEEGRAEYQWLKNTRPYLQPGGLLVYVVPQHMLRHRQTARYLTSWFSDLNVYRFPDESYPQFKQVIVFGRCRPKSAIPDSATATWLKGLAEMGERLQPITEPPGRYFLPKPIVPDEQFTFRGMFIKPDTAVLEARSHGLKNSLELHQHLVPGAGLRKLEPLTPMKIGHLTSIIAAGHINNQVLEVNGRKLLIKGSNYKIKKMSEEREQREDGYVLIEKLTENVVTKIVTLTPGGDAHEVEGEELADFLEDWIDPLTQVVATSYPPKYTFDLNGFGPALHQLNLGRMIPLIGKPGLLPTQKHAAAAAATRLLTHDEAIIVGKMGTGKTLMGPATVAALRSKGMKMNHIIVICPPHLVKKWIREIKVVWPEAKATHLQTIDEVDRFFRAKGPIFGIMKETTARSGSGWEHAVDYVGPRRLKTRGPKDEVTYLGNDKFPYKKSNAAALTYQLSHGMCCPVCGKPATTGDLMLGPEHFKSAKVFCDHCHSPMWQDTRFGEAGKAKYPLATYIKKRYKKQLDMLIADECHQFKGQDSDRGYAFSRLCTAARKVLLLTGTIYGGKASTLFYLLYRASAEFRHAYTNKEKNGKSRLMLREWVARYGILQEVESTRFDENGKTSGNSKSRTIVKELPGGSPAMLPWLLNNSVFVSLEDMGYALPGYKEIPVSVKMTPAMHSRYSYLEKQLSEELRKRLLVGDKSLLGAYLQSLLSWPDSPWRNKGVSDPKGKIIAFVDALPNPAGSYPKEVAIIERIKQSKADGRKVLLACQQTNTLDITPQWVAMLAENGIKAAVLKVEASKREAWYEQQMKAGVDVIITHPKRVETGLDLMECVDLIWMGTEYSIYTIQQFNKRSYRIGQTKDVNVYFFVYEDTLQEKALHLIAAKIAAAGRVDGDIVQDDTLAELDDLAGNDMVTALGKLVMGEMDFEEQMKEINEAYEQAQKGNLTHSSKYSFADCTDAKSITKRYRQLARKYHPDVADAAQVKVKSLNDVFAEANAKFQQEDGFIGGFEVDNSMPDVENFTFSQEKGEAQRTKGEAQRTKGEAQRTKGEAQRTLFNEFGDKIYQDENGRWVEEREIAGFVFKKATLAPQDFATNLFNAPRHDEPTSVPGTVTRHDDPPFEPGRVTVAAATVENGGASGDVTLETIGADGELHAYNPDDDKWECVTCDDEVVDDGVYEVEYTYDPDDVQEVLDEYETVGNRDIGYEPPTLDEIDYGWDDDGFCTWCEMPEDACECEHPTYEDAVTVMKTNKYDRLIHIFTSPQEAKPKSERPAIYRNGTSCTAMKEVETGVWMQCSKLELHKGFCNFSLGPDWKEKEAAKSAKKAKAQAAKNGDGAAAPPETSPKVATAAAAPTKPPKRLVFGVHDAYGKMLPKERLDKVGAQQMSLFG